MKRAFARRPARRTAATLVAAVLLLAAMPAALGAGPDEPAASNVESDWQTFEGHAFSGGYIVPEGVLLTACLGGCERGYVSEPAAVGPDGRYGGLRVAPGHHDRSALPNADLVTFWILGPDGKEQASQWALFIGDGQTHELHLSFAQLPSPAPSLSATERDTAATELPEPDADQSAVAREAVATELPEPDAGQSAVAREAVATELPEPDADRSAVARDDIATELAASGADRLRLATVWSPRSAIHSWSYGGAPVLPGLTIAAGLLLVGSGVFILLMRRHRRLTW